MTAFKLASAPGGETDDVEATIWKAKRAARTTGAAVDVVGVPGNTRIARVWPDGKIDVTWAGARYA
jgi:hypothetical protein